MTYAAFLKQFCELLNKELAEGELLESTGIRRNETSYTLLSVKIIDKNNNEKYLSEGIDALVPYSIYAGNVSEGKNKNEIMKDLAKETYSIIKGKCKHYSEQLIEPSIKKTFESVFVVDSDFNQGCLGIVDENNKFYRVTYMSSNESEDVPASQTTKNAPITIPFCDYLYINPEDLVRQAMENTKQMLELWRNENEE